MPRDVAVEALVDAKQAQQVRWDLVRRGGACSLPEEGVEVVGLSTEFKFLNSLQFS